MSVRVHQQILWLDVSVANTEGVNVGEGPERLVCVQLDQDHWYLLLHLVVVLEDPEHGLWHVVHHDVQVDFIWLITLSIERMLERDHVGVIELLHNLQLSVLVSLVLVHLLDGDSLTVFIHGGLEDDSEGAIADNTVSIIGERSGLLVVFLLFLIGKIAHIF